MYKTTTKQGKAIITKSRPYFSYTNNYRHDKLLSKMLNSYANITDHTTTYANSRRRKYFFMITDLNSYALLPPCSCRVHPIEQQIMFTQHARAPQRSLGTPNLIRSKVPGHPGANQGLVVGQVQVWAGCKRSAGSGHVREKASCPLGLVKGDERIYLIYFSDNGKTTIGR